VRVNIEPNKAGYCHPDEYYRSNYLSGNDHYSLTNLTRNQTIGILYYSIGTIALKRRSTALALACLWESCRRAPFLIEARGNLALVLAVSGKTDSAMTMLGNLFDSFPSYENLAANYGEVAMAKGDPQKALQIFREGLRYFPSDPRLISGFAQAYSAHGKPGFNRDKRKTP
jgi:predicted Zn-dependent protease